MDGRTAIAVAIAIVLFGPPLLVAEFVHIPMEARRGMPTAVYVLQIELVAIFGIAVVGILLHQYVRWRKHRPAIHLAATLILAVVGLVWTLDLGGIGASQRSLTPPETHLIRAVGVGLLLYVVLVVADLLENTDGKVR